MRLLLSCVGVLAACAFAGPNASAATAKWWACGKAGGAAAAQAAGFPAAMDADPRLRETFGDEAPSSVLNARRAYCADFDRDGDVDRAVMYTCCTVSSPSPYAILRNDATTWTTVYARLSDIVFQLAPRGGRLIARSPKYAATDPNCCPSRLSVRELRFTRGKWVGRVTVRRAR
jgi:hypothetical protein